MTAATEIFIRALRDGNAGAFEQLATVLADDVEFASAITDAINGPADVIAQLQRFQAAGRFARATAWDEHQESKVKAQVIAELPLNSYYAKYTWDLTFDEHGSVEKIAQAGVQQTEPLPPSEVRIGADIDDALRQARETSSPLIVAYVNDKGQPSQSPRGTTQTFGDRQLAMWIHRRSGGIVSAIDTNPNVSLHYWGGIGTAYGGTLLFQGQAHFDDREETRRAVYENSPPSEQRSDPNRDGCALIIDLYRVFGFVAGTRYNMESDSE